MQIHHYYDLKLKVSSTNLISLIFLVGVLVLADFDLKFIISRFFFKIKKSRIFPKTSIIMVLRTAYSQLTPKIEFEPFSTTNLLEKQ